MAGSSVKNRFLNIQQLFAIVAASARALPSFHTQQRIRHFVEFVSRVAQARRHNYATSGKMEGCACPRAAMERISVAGVKSETPAAPGPMTDGDGRHERPSTVQVTIDSGRPGKQTSRWRNVKGHTATLTISENWTARRLRKPETVDTMMIFTATTTDGLR